MYNAQIDKNLYKVTINAWLGKTVAILNIVFPTDLEENIFAYPQADSLMTGDVNETYDRLHHLTV